MLVVKTYCTYVVRPGTVGLWVCFVFRVGQFGMLFYSLLSSYIDLGALGVDITGC